MNNRKPLGIVLAALGAVLLLTAAAALLSARFGGGQRSGDASAPYPYACVERSDGTVALTLSGREADETWYAPEGGGVAVVTLGATKRGRATATLAPDAEGRAELSFPLRRGEETLAVVTLTVETRETEDGALALAVVAHRERVMQSALRGGDETGCPFTAGADETGALLIHIADPAVAALLSEDGLEADLDTDSWASLWGWTVRSGNPAVLLASISDVDETGLTLRVDASADGEAEVAADGEAAGVSYVFSVLSQGGTVRLADWSAAPYAPRGVTAEADAPSAAETPDGEAAPTPTAEQLPEEETDADGEYLVQTEPEPGQPETSDVPYVQP